MKYNKIFEPIKINKTEFKNRLVVSAMVTSYCNEDGTPTERFIAYHEEKAKGGWGIICTEDYTIAPNVGGFKKLPGLWDDHLIEPHKELTERVHKQGGKIVAQIYHAGRETTTEIAGAQPVGPSPIKEPSLPEIPRELTIDEIAVIVKQYAECARRVKETGFDGVEIHGAHGYLIGAFISPLSNKRTDEYGGSLEGRAKFPLEVVAAVRNAVGPDYPIFFRMSANEYVDGGFSLQEAKLYAQLLEEAGVDCIHCSQGIYVSCHTIQPPSIIPEGYYAENAAALKEVVNIPVITVGKYTEPMMVETVLRTGKADLVTMARASLADPHLPNKVKEGRIEDIIRCIGCVQGCLGDQLTGVRCMVNPRTGKEYCYKQEQAKVKKRIVVIGGGVSGCEFAIGAAERGHEVSIYEKADRLGGQWLVASMPPGKTAFTTFPIWQKKRLADLGVEIHLNTVLQPDDIAAFEPDVVILATGSKPIVPRIEGVSNANVVTAHDILSGKVNIGQNVVIIGGGLVGAETADYMAQNGCNVTIIEMLSGIALEGEHNPTYYLLDRLEKQKVKTYVNSAVTEIGEGFIRFKENGELHTLENIDQVVLAVGVKSDNALEKHLNGSKYRVISIGDAKEVAEGYHDIQTAYDLAQRI
ncbi:MAG: FAD-dependent oxidoreductase [Clostridiales Family XIII bacterium]|nr:FAD-dependent oxidoreductase [Clostridia bacterium]MDY3010682.1 FAD-dependent oxidoreductase [Clostridiales Family XIII bacterium]